MSLKNDLIQAASEAKLVLMKLECNRQARYSTKSLARRRAYALAAQDIENELNRRRG